MTNKALSWTAQPQLDTWRRHTCSLESSCQNDNEVVIIITIIIIVIIIIIIIIIIPLYAERGLSRNFVCLILQMVWYA